MFEKYIDSAYQERLQPLLESVFSTMGEAIVVANEAGKIIMVNMHVEALWGYAPETLIGEDLIVLMPEHFHKAHQGGMRRYIDTGQQKVLNQRVELEAVHRSGKIFPIQLYIAETNIGGERCFTAAIRDISQVIKQRRELKKAHDMLREHKDLVEHRNVVLMQEIRLDPMTRVLNHAALLDRLEKELNRLARVKSSLAILFIDIDDFKSINDMDGHLYGDSCLIDLVALLEKNINRAVDVVGRYGGEEFILILPNTSSSGAMMLADRLRSAVENHDWELQPVTITIGTAATDRKINCTELIDQADKALYYGKQNGKNQVNDWGSVNKVN